MELPVIDLAPYLEKSAKCSREVGEKKLDDPNLQKLCEEVSRTLAQTGALLVKDPRCSAQDNDRFIDMMEKYFQRPPQFKRLQERPHLHYQVFPFFTTTIIMHLFLDHYINASIELIVKFLITIIVIIKLELMNHNGCIL
ncbi:hypothetical protein CsSME_00024614 [Camellia sinensis var. sinensis]